MKKFRCLSLLLLVILAFSLSGCGKGDEKSAEPQLFSGLAMTIPYRILIGAPAVEADRNKLSRIIIQTFAEVDETYNKYNPYSEVTRLNNAKAGEKVQLSYAMAAFLLKVEEIVVMTEGRFDPTVETYQGAWIKHLEGGEVISEEAMTRFEKAAGWHNVHIQNGWFHKDFDETRIDLGGIAKGYAVDLLVKKIKEAGYPNVFVEWGGEIFGAGKHPAGRPWNVFISRLDDTDPDKAIAHVSLMDRAIATSGDYLQNWKMGNERYSHVFDPLGRKPMKITENSVASASVAAPSCFLADGIATAALTFQNFEEAKTWADQLSEEVPEIAMWLVGRKGAH